jgi:AIG2-like family
VGGDAAEQRGAFGLMLHFAYGSNMHRAVMRKYAPHAQPLGIAALADFRFVITADGYASVVPRRGETVHGVLWRLTPRDRVTLDAWEGITAGRYRAAALLIGCAGSCRPALVYMARPLSAGRAKAGYMELVIAAAQEWKLPADYISSLQRWLPRRPSGGIGRERGEFPWT